jgi:hypothetical protein
MSEAREMAAAVEPGRRSGRLIRRIPILLFGHDEQGHTFTERTHTVVLSLHGAGILSTHRFTPEQELVLRVEETTHEAEVRVVGEIAVEGELHTYGVAFIDDNLDFWQLEFPQAPVSGRQPRVLPLECGSCGERIAVANGEFEYDISQIHGGLTRHCAQCGTLTVWRRADGKGSIFVNRALEDAKPLEPQDNRARDIPAKERRFASSEIRSPGPQRSKRAGDAFFRPGRQATDARKPGWRDEVPKGAETAATELGFHRAGNNFSGLAQEAEADLNVPERIFTPPVEETVEEEATGTPTSEAARDPGVERRRRARAKVNFFAGVRTAKFGLDVVTCLDMSKGGVGFRSRNPYKQGMKIQIAVPYAPEVKDAPTIFVLGRIANVRETDGMWRCGVEFLKET